jgi:murein L,D-transpeptidase YafK
VEDDMNRAILAAAVFFSFAATTVGVKRIVTPAGLPEAASAAQATHAGGQADRVVIEKGDRLLLLYRHRQLIGSYRIALGGHPFGPKQTVGDERTPEGTYLLDQKDPTSAFYKSIRVSFPNAYDMAAARLAHRAAPSGVVLIHGQKPVFDSLAPISRSLDWTDGSIALSNSDMDRVWAAVAAGTPVEIRP